MTTSESPSHEPPSRTTSADASNAQPAPPWAPFAAIAVLSSITDLASKEWATWVLTRFDVTRHAQRTIDVVPGWFDLRYAQNPGGAWSMLRSLPELYRRPFFLFVSAAASVFITSVYSRIDPSDRAMRWGLPLALGGAIGNLVDRMRHGYVVDFLHAYANLPKRSYHWPTFNVADVWIFVGVALMGYSMLFGVARRQAEALAARPADPS
jgi:signal peptidase II